MLDSPSLWDLCEDGQFSEAIHYIETHLRETDFDEQLDMISGDTVLLAASKRGADEFVPFLLEQGCDVHRGNFWGLGPLTMACCNGHLAMVQILLAINADVQQEDELGNTPLFFAVTHDHSDIVRELLRSNAAVDHRRHCDGYTALICASLYNSSRSAEVLLREGCAEVNITADDGDTAMSLAMRLDSSEVVDMLSSLSLLEEEHMQV